MADTYEKQSGTQIKIKSTSEKTIDIDTLMANDVNLKFQLKRLYEGYITQKDALQKQINDNAILLAQCESLGIQQLEIPGE